MPGVGLVGGLESPFGISSRRILWWRGFLEYGGVFERVEVAGAQGTMDADKDEKRDFQGAR